MSDWQPEADLQTLQMRARMLADIRAFFAERKILEVETPLLSRHAATDVNIDSIGCTLSGHSYYLNTSPEFAMKRLLASYACPIYQITRAFRDDEHGLHHNPEFSMLEWYRPGFDMYQLIDEVETLVRCLADRSLSDAGSRFQRISYAQAFHQVFGVDPHQLSAEACYGLALERGIEVPQGLGKDDTDRDAWLDWLLTQSVMPEIAGGSFEWTFLYDYPSSQAALAVIDTDAEGRSVAKRFELFFGELELANGFYELTDVEQQHRRFTQDNDARRAAGKPQSPVDDDLLAALKHGLPLCSGVAVGLDRLLMVMSGKAAIRDVLAFSIDRA